MPKKFYNYFSQEGVKIAQRLGPPYPISFIGNKFYYYHYYYYYYANYHVHVFILIITYLLYINV